MKKISERSVYEGEWLSVHEMHFENKKGVPIIWETVKRKKSSVGVVVVARLLPSARFILIKQFRPAIHGYIIGFPAGLAFGPSTPLRADPEQIQSLNGGCVEWVGNPEHALIELKEETGYQGKIVQVSPVLKTGSSLSNDSGQIVCIEVDEHDPANQNPEQHLEPSEDIEVCLVKIDKVREFLLKQSEEGHFISSNVWYMFGLKDFIG